VFSEKQIESGPVGYAELTIDCDRRLAIRASREIRLTAKEFESLSLLAWNAGRVITHHAILKAMWGAHVVNQPEHL